MIEIIDYSMIVFKVSRSRDNLNDKFEREYGTAPQDNLK